jgi:8-oxo-dGTP pyrophosphatase MutT (NUDIX family)
MSEVHPAATVLLLRDTPSGVEVFMQRRGAGAAFMAGAYVFPGGKLDPWDADPDGTLTDIPGAEDAGLRMAAVREVFEEAGVLLGTIDGVPVGSAFLDDEAARVRSRLHDRSDAFDWRPWLAEHGVRLATSSLGLASRWVTPELEPRRFDTWFYRVDAPVGQVADHDGIEMSDSMWVTPDDVLRRADAGEVMVVPPTRRNLEALSAFATAAEAAEAPDGSADPILPHMEAREDGSLWVSHDSFGELRVR